MVLNPDQIDQLSAANKRLIIIGDFGTARNANGSQIFEFKNPSAREFFKQVQPAIGRVTETIKIGTQSKSGTKLQPPRNLEDSDREALVPLLADSPLLQPSNDKSNSEWGKEIFEDWLQAVHVVTFFEHPKFSEDLIDLSRVYLSLSVRGKGNAFSKLGDFLSIPSNRKSVLKYLLCPASDENSALEEVKVAINSGKLGDAGKNAPKYIEELKAVLSSGIDANGNFKKATTGDGANCQHLESGTPYRLWEKNEADLPVDAKDFVSAYGLFRRNSDKIHSYCRSPELWSFIFRYFGSLAGKISTVAIEKDKGIQNLFNFCFKSHANRSPAASESQQKAFNQRVSDAEKTFWTGAASPEDKKLRELNLIRLRVILSQIESYGDPSSPIYRKDFEKTVCDRVVVMSFMLDTDFQKLRQKLDSEAAELMEVANCFLKIDFSEGNEKKKTVKKKATKKKVAGSKNSNGLNLSDFESLLDETESILKLGKKSTQFVSLTKLQKEKLVNFLAFAKKQEIDSTGYALRDKLYAEFGGWLAELQKDELEQWAKQNKKDQIKIVDRLGRVFRHIIGAQGVLGATNSGHPSLVKLDSELLLEKIKEYRQTQKESSTSDSNITAKLEGTLETGDFSDATISTKSPDGRDVQVGKISRNGEEIEVVLEDANGPWDSLEIHDSSNGEPITLKNSTKDKEDGEETKVVELNLTLSKIDEATNGSIREEINSRTQRVEEELGDEITKDDLDNFENLLKQVHESYADTNLDDEGTKTARRAARCVVLGKYFLSCPNQNSVFGKYDVSNIVGLVEEMFFELGDTSPDGKLAMPNSTATRHRLLKRIDLSRYYRLPEDTGEGLAALVDLFQYHDEVAESTIEARDYLQEVRAIASLCDSARGADLELILVNESADAYMERHANSADLSILTTHPSRVLYFTSQNDDQNINSFWSIFSGPEGLIRYDNNETLQIPIFVAHWSEDSDRSGIDSSALPFVSPKKLPPLPTAKFENNLHNSWPLVLAVSLTSAQISLGNISSGGPKETAKLKQWFKKIDTSVSVEKLLRQNLFKHKEVVQQLFWSRIATVGILADSNDSVTLDSVFPENDWTKWYKPALDGISDQLRIGGAMPGNNADFNETFKLFGKGCSSSGILIKSTAWIQNLKDTNDNEVIY